MVRYAAALFGVIATWSTSVLACPDGQYSSWGMCLPEIGGEVGKAWEKQKKEIENFKNDVRVWIDTGKCGGDICDAFAAVVQFGKDEVTDTGKSLERAGQRMAEGKPLDAVWHLQTDFYINEEQNAAKAAFRSRVLMATGQVAATVYGGPQGAAAYTAWLAYNSTHNVEDALKAGIISGATAAALGSVNQIQLTGAAGIAARSVLTGAVNGAAVAAAGGSQSEIREAATMGVAAVLIREGYHQLTSFDLNEQRMRSSTGEAYCLADMPTPDYLTQTSPSGCFGPPSAYEKDANGNVKFREDGFTKLDPDRPHVGTWAHQTDSPPLISPAENSRMMTGISRLPGWNAMAVAHDTLTNDMNFDLLPGGVGIIPTVATIPPSLVLTYVGSGYGVHDAIRDVYKNKRNQDAADQPKQTTAHTVSAANKEAQGTVAILPPSKSDSASPTEVMHVFCGAQEPNSPEVLHSRTDVLLEVSASGDARGQDGRLCEVGERIDGKWYELGHAHHQINYCHRLAERIVRNRLNRAQACFFGMGLKENG